MKITRLVLGVAVVLLSGGVMAAQPPNTRWACTNYADSVLHVRFPSELGGLKMVYRTTYDSGDDNYGICYDSNTNRTEEAGGRILDVFVYASHGPKMPDGSREAVRKGLADVAETILHAAGNGTYLDVKLADQMHEGTMPGCGFGYLWFSHTLRFEKGGELYRSVSVLWAWHNRFVKFRYREPAPAGETLPPTQLPPTVARALKEFDDLIVASEKAGKVDIYAIDDPDRALAALRQRWAGVEDRLPQASRPDFAQRELVAIVTLGRWKDGVECSGEDALAACRDCTAAKLDPPTWYYNTACVLAIQGKKDQALQALEQAVAAGFGAAEQIEKDEDLKNLRTDPRFVKLRTLAARVGVNSNRPVRPATVNANTVRVDEEDVVWDSNLMAYALELDKAPSNTLIYVDRQRPHRPAPASNLVSVVWSEPFVTGKRDVGEANLFVWDCARNAPLPALAVCGTVEKGDLRSTGQSLPWNIWTSWVRSCAATVMLQRNVLGIYSIGSDWGADGIDRVLGWHADMLVYDGAADSDALVRLCAEAWQAMKPEVREAGGIRQLIGLLRRGQTCVRQPDDFLSGPAQRPALFVPQLDRAKILDLARHLDKPYPAMPAITNAEPVSTITSVSDLWIEPFTKPKIGSSEMHTSFVVRWAEKTSRFRVRLNKLDGTPVWKVLQGDPAKVRFFPQTSVQPNGMTNEVMEIECDYHTAFEVTRPDGRKMKSTRVDIGCFQIQDGVASLPAVVSIFFMPGETRVYGADGRLASIDYTRPQIPGWQPYLCPRADFKDEFHWAEDGSCLGWTRTDREGKRTDFTREGFAVMTRDELGRPKDVRHSLTMEWMQQLDPFVTTGREYRVQMNKFSDEYDGIQDDPNEATLAWQFTYTNEQDRVGTVAPREAKPFAVHPELCPFADLDGSAGFKLPLIDQLVFGYENYLRYKYDLFDSEKPPKLKKMRFSPWTPSTNDVWKLDLDAFEAESAEVLVEQSDGPFRYWTRTEDGRLVYSSVRNTMRIVGYVAERAAYEQLDRAFHRCSDFETRQVLSTKVAPAKWKITAVATERPLTADQLTGDQTVALALWRISKKMYFGITADFDSGFNTRRYFFARTDGDGFATSYDFFYELPSRAIGSTMLAAFAGDAAAINNFAVLFYAGIANPGGYNEPAVKAFLELAAEKGCKEAAANLEVLKSTR